MFDIPHTPTPTPAVWFPIQSQTSKWISKVFHNFNCIHSSTFTVYTINYSFVFAIISHFKEYIPDPFFLMSENNSICVHIVAVENHWLLFMYVKPFSSWGSHCVRPWQIQVDADSWWTFSYSVMMGDNWGMVFSSKITFFTTKHTQLLMQYPVLNIMWL